MNKTGTADFFSPMPVVVAHRGDSRHYPENTLEAFASAVQMGVDVIETDVHLSRDGYLVIWHDPTLERNTNGSGRIEDHTLQELKELDAGYTFSPDGGKSFPFRGTGIRLATLEEALTAFPHQRFNVDMKSRNPAIVDAFIDVIRRTHAEKRVIAASFAVQTLRRIRRKAPDIQSSLAQAEVIRYLLRFRLGLLPRRLHPTLPTVFQVPTGAGPITLITPRFVKAMHQRGAIIQVWTINEREEMIRLLDMGVDSVMTDDPALLQEVVQSRATGLSTEP